MLLCSDGSDKSDKSQQMPSNRFPENRDLQPVEKKILFFCLKIKNSDIFSKK